MHSVLSWATVLRETNSDMADGGVGDAALKPSNISDGVSKLGSLRLQHDFNIDVHNGIFRRSHDEQHTSA